MSATGGLTLPPPEDDLRAAILAWGGVPRYLIEGEIFYDTKVFFAREQLGRDVARYCEPSDVYKSKKHVYLNARAILALGFGKKISVVIQFVFNQIGIPRPSQQPGVHVHEAVELGPPQPSAPTPGHLVPLMQMPRPHYQMQHQVQHPSHLPEGAMQFGPSGFLNFPSSVFEQHDSHGDVAMPDPATVGPADPLRDVEAQGEAPTFSDFSFAPAALPIPSFLPPLYQQSQGGPAQQQPQSGPGYDAVYSYPVPGDESSELNEPKRRSDSG